MTAEALLRRGQKVRALTRTVEQGAALAARRAEVVAVDLLDADALTAALSGVAGAFLLLPMPPQDADLFEAAEAMVKSMVTAVKRAKVPTVVFLSSVGAQHPAGTGPTVALHRAEKAFAGVAKSVTFLRAAELLERFAPLMMDALESGSLTSFGNPHAAFPQVGAKDVGEAAAQALEEHAAGTRFIEVAGAQNWSADDVAVVVASVLQQPVHAVEAGPEAELAFHLREGLTPARAALMVERSQAHARGLLHFAHPHDVRRGTTSLFDAVSVLMD